MVYLATGFDLYPGDTFADINAAVADDRRSPAFASALRVMPPALASAVHAALSGRVTDRPTDGAALVALVTRDAADPRHGAMARVTMA